MDNWAELAAFLVSAALFSAFAGRVTEVMAEGKIVSSAARLMMRFTRTHHDKIRFFMIWAGYLLTILMGIIAASFAFDYNPFMPGAGREIPGIPSIIIVTFAGFLFQFELSSMILLAINAISGETNWYQVILEIGWIKVSFNLPRHVRIFYPMSAALMEEVFFRGCVFGILMNAFPWVPVPVSAFIATALFVLQQALCTRGGQQAIAISAGSFALSVAGCFMTAMSGSVIPAVICHELYVVFYLKK